MSDAKQDMTIKSIEANPEFDPWFYAEVSNEKRLEQSLMEEMEPRWNKWKDMIKVQELVHPRGPKFLLVFLPEEVDSEIEGMWQDSPSLGMSFHNLAITMVMTVARELIPEVVMNGCAPLPKPGEAAIRAFEELGLEWKKEGSLNRQYAVYTPYPYKGGCEVCYLSDTCPKSKTKQQ